MGKACGTATDSAMAGHLGYWDTTISWWLRGRRKAAGQDPNVEVTVVWLGKQIVDVRMSDVQVSQDTWEALGRAGAPVVAWDSDLRVGAEPRDPSKKDVALEILRRGSMFVHLDPRRACIPMQFKAQSKLVLQVGLNMPLPIPDLRVDDAGICGTLSFSRKPFHCIVPWSAVHALSDDSGRGKVWEADMPAPMPAEPSPETPAPVAQRPAIPPPAPVSHDEREAAAWRARAARIRAHVLACLAPPAGCAERWISVDALGQMTALHLDEAETVSNSDLFFAMTRGEVRRDWRDGIEMWALATPPKPAEPVELGGVHDLSYSEDGGASWNPLQKCAAPEPKKELCWLSFPELREVQIEAAKHRGSNPIPSDARAFIDRGIEILKQARSEEDASVPGHLARAVDMIDLAAMCLRADLGAEVIRVFNEVEASEGSPVRLPDPEEMREPSELWTEQDSPFVRQLVETFNHIGEYVLLKKDQLPALQRMWAACKPHGDVEDRGLARIADMILSWMARGESAGKAVSS